MSASPPFVFAGFSAADVVLGFDHKVSPCSQRALGFKPDGDFIFRFGGSAVVYHGKMK